jgi:hypothetical protein
MAVTGVGVDRRDDTVGSDAWRITGPSPSSSTSWPATVASRAAAATSSASSSPTQAPTTSCASANSSATRAARSAAEAQQIWGLPATS